MTSQRIPRIMTVCTGNICRSPAMAIMLRDALQDEAALASCGTHAMVGHPIPPPMLVLLADDELDGSTHAAQQITKQSVHDADLILVASRGHRRYVVELEPSAVRKTFLLLEAAAIARVADPPEGDTLHERVTNAAAALAAGRLVVDPIELASAADVTDPYLSSDRVYRASYAQMTTGVIDLTQWLKAE